MARSNFGIDPITNLKSKCQHLKTKSQHVQISLFRETKQTQETMDAVMLRLLHHNQLKEVRSINLYDGCFISMPVVRQLAFSCPELTAFSFLQFEGIEIADVERLKAEVAAKNLDIKVHCLETLDL